MNIEIGARLRSIQTSVNIGEEGCSLIVLSDGTKEDLHLLVMIHVSPLLYDLQKTPFNTDSDLAHLYIEVLLVWWELRISSIPLERPYD